MTKIKDILETNGPMMSSELVRQVQIENGGSLNTVSQQVRRSKDFKRISGFFVSGQAFCYLEQHVDEGFLYDGLERAMYHFGRKYWYTLNAIRMHKGSISQRFLQCYTNYPIEKLKQHLPFEVVMRKFVSEGILNFSGDDYIYSPKFIDVKVNVFAQRAIEVIKENIISHFHTLTRNIGLISYDSGESFAEFSKFRWAFKGVSPIVGLKNGGNYGFVLADILIGTSIQKDDVQFFIEKIKTCQSFKNASKVVPFLLIESLSPEALNHLKQHGIVVGFIKELFGEKYASTLRELITVLTNAGASLKADPDKYLELIKELRKYNEGLVNNIRGTLFEYVVGHIHAVHCQNIDLGREIIENEGRHEMDIIAVYQDKVVIAECKGKLAKVEIDDAEKWVKVKLPAFRKWFQKQETWDKKVLEFEYWSTSGYTAEAQQYLDKSILAIKKSKISYYGPVELRAKAKEMKNKKLKESLDNFFLKISV